MIAISVKSEPQHYNHASQFKEWCEALILGLMPLLIIIQMGTRRATDFIKVKGIYTIHRL